MQENKITEGQEIDITEYIKDMFLESLPDKKEEIEKMFKDKDRGTVTCTGIQSSGE